MTDACWLSEVCECGAITEGAAQNCWRCGLPLRREEDHDAPDAPAHN